MNTALVTTGLVPYVIGSTETFQLSADVNGLPWSLAGGSATIYFLAPDGTATNFAAVLDPFGAHYTWTVLAPVGNWTRCWKAVDGAGVVQFTRPIVFAVTQSP